jgi:parvulin-like peptidyl-prolyl isomerase
MKEKEELAKKIDSELKADPSKFEEYVNKYSTDTASKIQGGDLGYFAKDKMVPEFAQAAFAAKPNTITDVVQTNFGYHIIYVKDRRAAGTTPFKKVKSQIKEFLITQQQIASLDKLTTEAKKKAKIEFMDDRYNPETIQKKLTNQVDDLKNGESEKTEKESKK